MTSGSTILLANMPMSAVERPSLAMGLLKAILVGEGLTATAIYPNMWFLEYVGMADYHFLESSLPEEALVDWLFAGVAFPDFDTDQELFLTQFFERNPRSANGAGEHRATLLRLRAGMGEFIDWVVDRILEHRPAIVGCTSTFAQHVPCLALLRRLRERAPEIVTLMGGANCETVMGLTTHKNFPWVDYVVSGEADLLIGPLCRDILARGRDIPVVELAFGVFGPGHRKTGYPSTSTGDGVPRAIVDDMRHLPLPDFDEYFAEIGDSMYGARIRPGLPMEFSRGCWWGALSHCTFCGLNGGSMGYRQKPADNAAAEMIALSARYGTANIEAVDNILALDYIDKALPELSQLPVKLNIFFEVKANLKRHEVQKLAAAGVRWIQPGIESLDTRVLKLMGKGTTAAANIQLLKWCRQYGVRTSWSVLWGFPGEDDAWYAQMAPLFDALHHLQPGRAIRLRYQRYSPYHQRPETYGLKLGIVPSYRFVYPLDEADIANQVYYFEDSRETDAGGHYAGRDAARRPGLHALAQGMEGWLRSWTGPRLPMLTMRMTGDVLVVEDSRIAATSREHRFGGLARRILLAADDGVPETRLRDTLALDDIAAAQIDTTIDALITAKLVLRLDKRLIGLALWYPYTLMMAPEAFPGGHLERRNRALAAAA